MPICFSLASSVACTSARLTGCGPPAEPPAAIGRSGLAPAAPRCRLDPGGGTGTPARGFVVVTLVGRPVVGAVDAGGSEVDVGTNDCGGSDVDGAGSGAGALGRGGAGWRRGSALNALPIARPLPRWLPLPRSCESRTAAMPPPTTSRNLHRLHGSHAPPQPTNRRFVRAINTGGDTPFVPRGWMRDIRHKVRCGRDYSIDAAFSPSRSCDRPRTGRSAVLRRPSSARTPGR